MSDGTPTPVNPSQEVTQNYHPGAAPTIPNNNPWKTIALFLGMIVTGGTILSVVGKAFYVTRAEYTEKNQRDAVEQTTLKQTLENVRVALDNQKTEFKSLSDIVKQLEIRSGHERDRLSR